MMTPTEQFLAQLADETKAAFAPAFIDTTHFYATCYLIARNEHIYGQEKPQGWEESIKVVHAYQQRIVEFLNTLSLDGEELMADIKSDYLEDYINYRERALDIDQERFMQIMRHIQAGL